MPRRWIHWHMLCALATAAPTVAYARTSECRWTEKHSCSPGKGCQPSTLGVWATIDLQAKRYQRCDRNGCDTHDAIVTVGPGAFTFVDLPGRGMMLKLGPGGAATEVVSLGNTVLVSQGRCH